MAKGDGAGLRPSILERLSERDASADASWSVADYRRSVLRDVEWLLNHRRTIEPASDAFPEVRRSVYHYGLPDLTAFSAESGEARSQVRMMVEELIRTFEPRLEAVRVRIPEEEGPRRRVRFVIEALLRMDPNPERVAFDTVLEAGSGSFTVRDHA